MATIRLVPSTYTLSSTSYLSISNATNMYNNTDNTTYATVTNSRSSTTSYYIYVRGFNFDDIPENVVINSFTVKLKARESGVSTSTSYGPLCSGSASSYSSTYSALTASGVIDTTSGGKLITFSGTTAFETIKSAGANFGIRINCRRASSNTTGYMYIYGAEIEVDYTQLEEYDVTVTNNVNEVTVSPMSATVVEGNDISFTIDTDDISEYILTDNGTDVISQAVRTQLSADTACVLRSYTGLSNFTTSNMSNAYNGSDNITYAQLTIAGSSNGVNGHIYWLFDTSAIPNDAVIQSISCDVTLQFNTNNSTSGFTSTIQMYTGTTAKGSATTWVSSGSNVAKNTYSLTTGDWTLEELADARIYITATNSARQNSRYIYVYGATLTVTCEVDGYVYIYTINSINEDHTIVFDIAKKLFLKSNNSWISISKIYIKQNGSWIEQNLDYLTTQNIQYLLQGGIN